MVVKVAGAADTAWPVSSARMRAASSDERHSCGVMPATVRRTVTDASHGTLPSPADSAADGSPGKPRSRAASVAAFGSSTRGSR